MKTDHAFALWCAAVWEPVVSLSWFDPASDERWPRLWHSYVVYPSTGRGLLLPKDEPPTTYKEKSNI